MQDKEVRDIDAIPIEEWTDEELSDRAHTEASNMSFYNAAESPQWTLETEARQRCQARFKRVMDEVGRRNLYVDLRGYLL